jgi:uncharacterized membrane protein YraQ (UPF0718 family)
MLDTLRQIAVDFWATIAEMSPYLLFGFFVAGVLSILISQRVVERHLGGHGMLPLLKATVFGIPLPLCSCGVIPVSMSLHQHGASKGATVSFLLSTPQTGVDSIFVTYSLLGPVFAVFRPLAALVTGLLGGGLVDIFVQREAEPSAPAPCADECCSRQGVKSRLLTGMKYAFVTLPRDIGKAMLVGLALAAVIAVIVPDGFFAEKLGTGMGAMLLMMVLGIPLYVCATASVPVAAALILKGLTPGAALVFLMTGPATNAAGLATIWRTLGRRTALLYLLAVAGSALGAGMLLDFLALNIDIPIISAHHHEVLPPLIKHAAAVVLLALLAYGIAKPKRHH